MRLPIGYLLLISMLFTTTGATCIPRRPIASNLPPTAFATPPTIGELATMLNDASSRVTSLQSREARVSIPNVPLGIRADIAVERPNRLRLRGRMLGPEFDLGSNDELLWFWGNRDPTQSVYFARHNQLANSGLALPIEPQWLVDAFGSTLR